MSQPQSRIPDAMATDILGEAARLQSETHTGYSITDLEKICEEANISPQLLQQAVQNLEDLKSQRHTQRQQRRQVTGQLVRQGLRWGLVLIFPALAISGVVWFRPQLSALITAGVDRLQPVEESLAESLEESIDFRTQVSTQLTTLSEELMAIQQSLRDLKADQAASQPETPVLPPTLPQITPAAPSLPQTAPAPPSLSREAFRQRVQGKTESQVAAAVGRPRQTTQYGSTIFWDYDSVLDPWTDQEGDATVIFRGGKVEKVNFSN